MDVASDPSPPYLSVRNLSFRTASQQVLLQDVSFDLPKASVLAIAGPNGAGKTTLLNLLSGMEEVTQGEVTINGASLRTMPMDVRAHKLAVVAQHAAPDHRLSVQDYVAMGQMPIWSDHAMTDHAQALQEVLEITQLDHLSAKTIAQLSGGELQRAHIARALVQRPELLFLDEPTNHLDPDAKGRMLSLICGLGITVVMVLHDLVLIPEFATHVALMKDARLMAFGPVGEVQTPQSIADAFGVIYRLLPHEGRVIPALDIRKTPERKGQSL